MNENELSKRDYYFWQVISGIRNPKVFSETVENDNGSVVFRKEDLLKKLDVDM